MVLTGNIMTSEHGSPSTLTGFFTPPSPYLHWRPKFWAEKRRHDRIFDRGKVKIAFLGLVGRRNPESDRILNRFWSEEVSGYLMPN